MRKHTRTTALIAALYMPAGCTQGTSTLRSLAGPSAGTQLATADTCGETDPKLWPLFTYTIEENAEQTEQWISVWNGSSCARQTTWRAFAIGAGNAQSPAGPDMHVTIPAGAGYGAPGTDFSRPYKFKVQYYGDGLPPCAAVLQIDGRAGFIANMPHEGASFTFGRLFTIRRACGVPYTPPPPPPPTACTAPDVLGPWVPVPVVQPAFFPVSCPKQQRTRTACNGSVVVEPRPEFWCLEEGSAQ